MDTTDPTDPQHLVNLKRIMRDLVSTYNEGDYSTKDIELIIEEGAELLGEMGEVILTYDEVHILDVIPGIGVEHDDIVLKIPYKAEAVLDILTALVEKGFVHLEDPDDGPLYFTNVEKYDPLPGDWFTDPSGRYECTDLSTDDNGDPRIQFHMSTPIDRNSGKRGDMAQRIWVFMWKEATDRGRRV